MVPLVTNKAASFPVNPAALVCRADENNENQMLNFAEQRVSYLHLYKTVVELIFLMVWSDNQDSFCYQKNGVVILMFYVRLKNRYQDKQ